MKPLCQHSGFPQSETSDDAKGLRMGCGGGPVPGLIERHLQQRQNLIGKGL
jgi:hypothetical protein